MSSGQRCVLYASSPKAASCASMSSRLMGKRQELPLGMEEHQSRSASIDRLALRHSRVDAFCDDNGNSIHRSDTIPGSLLQLPHLGL